jgi:hypothetical protein
VSFKLHAQRGLSTEFRGKTAFNGCEKFKLFSGKENTNFIKKLILSV